MTWLLLDADMLLFQAVVSAEVEIEWSTDIITTHLPVKEAQFIFNELLETKYNQAQADRFTLCWTANENFRKDVAPTYKAHRTRYDLWGIEQYDVGLNSSFPLSAGID